MPVVILAPLLALGFAARAVGLTVAINRDRAAMGWGARIASWILFGLAVALVALSGSTLTVMGYAAFVVLDFAAGWSKREVKPAKERKPFPYRKVLLTTLAVAYAGFVVAFQLVYAKYLSYGVLLTWTFIALGFAVALRLWLAGPGRAGEAWLRAPQDHKRHERREARVVDPKLARADEILRAFRSRGDAGPFLDFVRESARAADLAEDDVRALESRILASFARAGTNRDADARAALDEVERILSLRRTLETRP